MGSFNDLVSLIKEKTKGKPHVVVAISGFGGSGKSYLANKLMGHFEVEEKQVIKIDQLYSPNPDGPDMFDQSDWVLLEALLKNVRHGNRLRYHGIDYRGDTLNFDESLPQVVIVEGIRLLQPRFTTYFDISVWIDCPQDFAMERAKKRDRSQGESEKEISRWDTLWGPLDKAYFDKYRPDKSASFLFKEFGGTKS